LRFIFGSARRIIRRIPISSTPFISGDTFQRQCDVSINKFNVLRLSENETPQRPKIFFVSADNVGLILDSIISKRIRTSGKTHTLVIHNGDNLPSHDEFEILTSVFRRIYSVNWLGSSSFATPLPIGLENRNLLQNGRLRYFRDAHQRGLPDLEHRSDSIIANFSLHTNSTERDQALSCALKANLPVVTEKTENLEQYFSLIANSKYVLSPPGNGPDCHRTWEALTLGAIPIVKRDYWPFSNLPLPVIQVDEWADIQAAIEEFQVTERMKSFDWNGHFLGLLKSS
jgi:hypothetical protein